MSRNGTFLQVRKVNIRGIVTPYNILTKCLKRSLGLVGWRGRKEGRRTQKGKEGAFVNLAAIHDP